MDSFPQSLTSRGWLDAPRTRVEEAFVFVCFCLALYLRLENAAVQGRNRRVARGMNALEEPLDV